MTDKQKFELWQYEKVYDISKMISVVKNLYTGKLMIHRYSVSESLDVLTRLSKISHNHIMRVYDCFFNGTLCESLCEYVDGVTLEQAVERGGAYDEQAAVSIMLQVCEGLKVLHGNSIIHRDINPSNIMITRNGQIKIIDFDITRVEKRGAPKDTSIFGTAGYTAPEQFGFAQTDERSDVYSCGVLLNFLLTGKLPSEQLYGGKPGEIIKTCTQIDSKKRYESASQLAYVLRGGKIKTATMRKPLPGFRSGKTAPKVFTVIGFVIYGIIAAVYISHIASYFNGGYESVGNTMRTYNMVALVLLGFWSAFPYIFIGDAFNLTGRLFKKHPLAGQVITKVLGGASIYAGFWLISVM